MIHCIYSLILLLQSKIESGEYVLEELIVPQTHKKVILTKDDTIKTELFTVSGRKIPLSDIRERTLKEHENSGLMHTRTDDNYASMTQEEVCNMLAQLGESKNCAFETASLNEKKHLKRIERTRHLMVWADNSTLLNHGYLLLTVSVLYETLRL